MLIIGHRGACGYEEENTLPSFDLAIAQGCSMVEFDVLVTSDQRIIVHHDDSLKRLTGSNLQIVNSTLEQIKATPTLSGNQIPTLEDTLAHIGNRCEMNIELKGPGTGMLTAEILAKLSIDPNQVLISSFYKKELLSFHAVRPDIRLARLYRIIPVNFRHRLPIYSIHIYHKVCNTALVKTAHKHGLKVHLFTCNTSTDWQKARDQGVDGIFTDIPDQAFDFFR